MKARANSFCWNSKIGGLSVDRTTRQCPYTEQCKAKARQDFAAFPELLAVFDKDECSTLQPARQEYCAARLGLKDDQETTQKPI